MKSITINAFSLEDVKRARKELVDYRDSLKTKLNALMQMLADKGVNLAKQNLSAYPMPYSRGVLENSIQGVWNVKEGRGAIFSDCGWACYVELGTGVMGERSPHEDSGSVGWGYDINHHGDEGWYYFDENSTEMKWTKGMPSRPFMSTTAQQLSDILEDMARQVFSK